MDLNEIFDRILKISYSIYQISTEYLSFFIGWIYFLICLFLRMNLVQF